jgi:hypothetical protein
MPKTRWIEWGGVGYGIARSIGRCGRSFGGLPYLLRGAGLICGHSRTNHLVTEKTNIICKLCVYRQCE